MNEMTFPEAIKKVLGESAIPLHYEEITERIVAQGLKTKLGATPSASVNAHISSSIKKQGTASPYVRVSKGVFALASQLSPTSALLADVVKIAPNEPEDAEPQYEIITSFGMFWRRNAVDWSPSPKLLGMQKLGSTPVDFCKQLGIYLLYDGREVIYIGRSTDRPLGRRLFEHTNDRLAVRWDRFSWFGLLPISPTGELGSLPADYESDKIIPALEAILIEALEPRQNRKRGDDLLAVEYLQREDPEIQKKRKREIFAEAIEKLS